MEAVTDVVFRHVVKQAGAPDVFFTEFANATGWVHAGDKAIAGRLVKTDDEHPLVAQIWGGEPGDMEQFAAHCAKLGFDGIDINMGCPAKSAIKSGGAALIRRPDVAVAAIAAAKTARLPVSVKTRLGYTYVDEWREWLATILQQNIVNLTVHLRTKKEMSKVPAHYELIDDIIKLRDEIAPQTLLTINGDIRDRGQQLDRNTGEPAQDLQGTGRRARVCERLAEQLGMLRVPRPGGLGLNAVEDVAVETRDEGVGVASQARHELLDGSRVGVRIHVAVQRHPVPPVRGGTLILRAVES